MSELDFARSASEDDIRNSARIPPYSMEAESSLLGSVLLEASVWDTVSEKVATDHFYRYEHRVIFEALTSLAALGKPLDVISVFEHLQRQGKADEAGGLPYLNDLAQFVPNAASVARYCEIVRERAILRKMMAAGSNLSSTAMAPGSRSIAELLGDAEQEILAIGQEATGIKPQSKNFDSLVSEAIARIERLSDNASAVTGVPTGYSDLDKMTAGMHPGDLLILAARPAMGKTSLALNIAEHVAVVQRLPVVVFSMEMGADQLTNRFLSSVSRVDQSRLRTGTLKDDDWSRLVEGVERLREIPMEIDDTPGLSIAQLRASARRHARKHGKLGLVVVDYIQLMSGSSSGSEESRVSELGEISRGLKIMAKELGCTVIALSQLNRAVEQRADKRPLVSDLRESGALEQDADLIWFIYRDEYYTKEASKDPGVAEVIIAKHRNGPTGTARLSFLNHLTRFENLQSL